MDTLLQRFISLAIIALGCIYSTGCLPGAKPITVSSDWVVATPGEVIAPHGLQWRRDIQEFARRERISLFDIRCSASGKFLAAGNSDNLIKVFDATPKIVGTVKLERGNLWCLTDAGVLASSTPPVGNQETHIFAYGGLTSCYRPIQAETMWLHRFNSTENVPARKEIGLGTFAGVGETCIALVHEGELQIIDLADPSSSKNCTIPCPVLQPPESSLFGDHDAAFAIMYKSDMNRAYVKIRGSKELRQLPVEGFVSKLLWLHNDVLTVEGARNNAYEIDQFHLNHPTLKPDVWHPDFTGSSSSPDGRLAQAWQPYSISVIRCTTGFPNSIWDRKQGWANSGGFYLPRRLFERIP